MVKPRSCRVFKVNGVARIREEAVAAAAVAAAAAVTRRRRDWNPPLDPLSDLPMDPLVVQGEVEVEEVEDGLWVEGVLFPSQQTLQRVE